MTVRLLESSSWDDTVSTLDVSKRRQSSTSSEPRRINGANRIVGRFHPDVCRTRLRSPTTEDDELEKDDGCGALKIGGGTEGAWSEDDARDSNTVPGAGVPAKKLSTE